MNRIYLDHAATTPVIPAARAAVVEVLDAWANPSSAHAEGRRARARLEDCRRRVSAALAWPGEVVFTSGATEALSIALTRASCDRRIIAAVEHPAVHRHATDALTIPVDRHGRMAIEVLPALLADAERPLVAVQSVNNETGVLSPIAAIGEQVRAAGGLLLVDCAQSAGKLPLPDADMIVVASHKLGGSPGAGALLLRNAAAISAVGGQEGGLRPGTHDLPAIAGFVAALEADRGWFEAMPAMRTRLEGRLYAAGAEVVGAAQLRMPTIGMYRMPGVPAASQMVQMDMAGIAVSAGSACSSGSVRPSVTLAKMGWPDAEAAEVLRVSFGRGTTADEIDAFADVWEALARRCATRFRSQPTRSGALAA